MCSVQTHYLGIRRRYDGSSLGKVRFDVTYLLGFVHVFLFLHFEGDLYSHLEDLSAE